MRNTLAVGKTICAISAPTAGADNNEPGWGFMFASRRNPSGSSTRRGVELKPASLGRAANVKGRLDCEGELHIHGNVVGRISAERMILGETGTIEGDVVAREVRILGKLNGRIFALEVMLEPSAQVEGRVFHHLVTVARGARIDGRMPWRPLNYFDSLEQLPEIQP